MNGLRYFKRMAGINTRQFAGDMEISLLHASHWSSGYAPISENHKEEIEGLYNIPLSLLNKEIKSSAKLKIDIETLKYLGKIKEAEDIVFNQTIFFDTFTALGYALFAKGMTKKELAYSMGISVATVHSFFKKKATIPKKYQDSLSNVLELPIELLEGKLYVDTKWAIDSLIINVSERKGFIKEIEGLNIDLLSA